MAPEASHDADQTLLIKAPERREQLGISRDRVPRRFEDWAEGHRDWKRTGRIRMIKSSASGIPHKTLQAQPPQARTTRLDVAAFLLARGFAILHTALENTTATFTFDDPDRQADDVVRDFYNGGQVSAKDYAAEQKRVRDLMWEAKRQAS